MTDQQQKPHWSLRLLQRPGLLIALTVCLALTGFVCQLAWRHHRTQRLANEINACGHFVVFEPGGPDWLRDMIGEDRMRPFDVPARIARKLPDLDGFPVTYPISSNSHLPSAHSEMIKGFDDETFLNLVVPLNDMSGLKAIYIWQDRLTVRSFKSLRRFDEFEELWIHSSEFNDQSMPTLSNLTQLRTLGLTGTSITDEGLKHLRGLKNLETLSVPKTGVTEQGLEELQKYLPQLDVTRE